jgi:hypothetical protein
LTSEDENVRSGEAELDRAAREALEAKPIAEKARQEVIEHRSQHVAADEAARASEAAVRRFRSSARSQGRGGNAANLNNFTIEPKRLPVFKGERVMQVVGEFINDLQRQFKVRGHEI